MSGIPSGAGGQQSGGFYIDPATGQMMQGGTLQQGGGYNSIGGYGGGTRQWVGGRPVAGFGQTPPPQWTPQAPFKQNPFIASQLAQTGLQPSQSVTNAFNAKMGKISQNSAQPAKGVRTSGIK